MSLSPQPLGTPSAPAEEPGSETPPQTVSDPDQPESSPPPQFVRFPFPAQVFRSSCDRYSFKSAPWK